MRTETISMMIDLQLAIRFAPSIPETRVINRAASKMLEIGTYTGCTETLQALATSKRADDAFIAGLTALRRDGFNV